MKFRVYKYLLTLTLLIGGLSLARSQNSNDSLLNLIENESDEIVQVNLYLVLAKNYLQTNPDSALIIANKALYLAKKIEYEQGIGDMYIILGHVRVIQNDLLNAMEYYLKALAIFKKVNNKESLTTTYLLLGNVYFVLSNYPYALDYYQQGVAIADSLNLTDILPHYYNNMGELNSKLHHYKAAIENLNKGLIIRQDENNELGAATILTNLSRMYSSLNENDTALSLLSEAHALFEKIGSNEGLFTVYSTYASLEMKQNNYQEAINYYKEGELFLEKIGSQYLGPTSILEAEFYSNIGYCYLMNKDYFLSEQNLLKGYDIAEKTGQLEYLNTTSEHLSQLYEVENKPVKALKYARYFKTYSDSLSRDENVKKLTQLEMQFKFDKQMKEQEIEQAKKELIQKRKELIYIMAFSGTMLALIILFLLFRLQKVKVKKVNLEKKTLQNDLDYKNKELTTNVMYLLEKNEFIMSISDKLKKSRYDFKPDNRKIVDDIIRELETSSTKDIWKDFEMRFQEVHADFYKKLIKQFPDLSPNELKLCAFLRLNMSTKEISTITFQSPKSISMARFRLRKKMGVGSYDNLINFLNQM